MKITRFEELECWKEARKLVKMVYDAIKANPKLSVDLRFSGQFSAAAVSAMSNIPEGFAKETDKEFSRGLWISKGSAAEVQVYLMQPWIKSTLLKKICRQFIVRQKKFHNLFPE